MAAGGIKIEGLEGLDEMLGHLAPREARNLNRATVHGMAGRVRDSARQKAPKDEGTLKKAIKSKRGKARNKDFPFSDVIVTHGRDVRYDAFYWRFVEYGTVDQPARPFIGPAADELRGQVPMIYREEFAKKYEKLLARKAKRRRR